MNEQRPILLGIVGDSAAGKTTITGGLAKILGEESVTHICTDDYHKYDRRERAERGVTPLRPECNYVDVLEQHMERLRNGQPILKPVYEHRTGTLVRPEYVRPRQFVIVEGLLGFSTALLREFYDVKVYLNPPEEMRREWKIKRDTSKRGYTVDQVLAELERREADSREFIRPQCKYADIAVTFFPPANVSPKELPENLNVRLVLRPTIPHPDLSYLVEGSGREGMGVRLTLGQPVEVPARLRLPPQLRWQSAWLCKTFRKELPFRCRSNKRGFPVENPFCMARFPVLSSQLPQYSASFWWAALPALCRGCLPSPQAR